MGCTHPHTPKRILHELVKLIILALLKLILRDKKKFFKLSLKRSGGRSTGYIRIQQIINL